MTTTPDPDEPDVVILPIPITAVAHDGEVTHLAPIYLTVEIPHAKQ